MRRPVLRVSRVALGAAFAALLSGTSGPRPAASLPRSLTRRLEDAIAAREYEASETAAGLQAPNRAQNLRTYFEPTGVRVVDRTDPAAPELVRLALRGVGRGGELAPVSPGAVVANRARVEIQRAELVEWYENRPEGLEQGFRVLDRPDGAGPLALELSVSGADLSLRDGGLDLRAPGGRRLRYAQLRASDARGRPVPCRVELAEADRVRVLLDDERAVYPVLVDPLLTSVLDARLSSEQASASFGYRVASAGDVDGDGYDDVIVGATNYSGGLGAAFVFRGGPQGIASGGPASASALLAATAGGPVSSFGWDVASAGDVNGDGYADVIVGGGGGAFVFLGGPFGVQDGGPASANTALTCASCTVVSVASAGDVNGDGYSDVIVTSVAPSAPQQQRAYLFMGGPAGIASGDLSTAPTVLDAPDATDGLQWLRAASAGDVNGDGYDDVMLSFDVTNSNPARGGVYIFLGSPAGIASSDTAHAATQLVDHFWDAEPAGDVNGDGYADVIVGRAYQFTGASSGAAFVFLGSAAGIASHLSNAASFAETQLISTQGCTVNCFGVAVGGAGDVNGDGYADVLVGAPAYNGAQLQEGAVYLFLGSASGVPGGTDASASATLVPAAPITADGLFGTSVASAGDVNGDGYADVIAGGPNISGEGAAFIALGGPRGLANATPASANGKLESNQASAQLGTSVAPAGDVNGDGYSDVIVGAPFFDLGETDEGAAFVFHGGPSGIALGNPANAATILQSNQAGAQLGASVASAGDVNGDGYADVIVGAPFYDDPNTNEGAAFVFLGSATGVAAGNPLNAHARFESDRDNAQLGASVASAGDVNGDGRSDVIVGAPGYPNGGAAFVFVSGPTGLVNGTPATAQATLQVSGMMPPAFGSSVASAGDMNGDGYGEVIVGAPQYQVAFVPVGLAVIYRGSPTGTDPNAATQVTSVGGNLGASVAGAGDVDGDGFDDVIVGAPGAGLARIYSGRASLPATLAPSDAATELTGSSAAQFGHGVAGVGDLNGDGLADIAVAAPLGTGAVSVFYGRAGGIPSETSAAADAELDGDQSGALFGNSVAGAGDVNGDGFADLVVGAPLEDSPQTDEGLAYLFYGGGRNGRPVAARQRRGNGSGVPVQLWGDALSGNSLIAQISATHPAGRGRVKAEAQACPEGVLFGGAGCVSAVSLSWTAVTPASLAPALSLTFSGLPPNKLVHWRARVLRADATEAVPQVPSHGPWRTFQAQASNESARTSLDADLDGVADSVDNCRYRANPGQEDTGGFGAGSPPDGIGDACQCGNVAGSGAVDTADVVAYRQYLANPSGAPLSPGAIARCTVLGTGAACNVLQVSAIRRGLQVPPLAPIASAAAAQVCAASHP